MALEKPRCRLASLLLAGLFAGCRGSAAPPPQSSSTDLPAGIDPRTIMRAQLSHGLGRSPLDDLMWEDSAHAALLVAAARGLPAAELIRSYVVT